MFEYPEQHTQTQRFRQAGFTQIEYQNLWELWADPRFLSPSQRMKLDHVEPFDEWEEFALWASHHCLVVAHNRGTHVLPERVQSRRNSDSSDASAISARTSSPNHPDSQLFAFRYYKDPGCLCQRHHGSAYPIPDQDAIAIYGGQGPKSILSTSAVCRPRHLNDETPVVLPPEVGPRCCHMLTSLNDGGNILVGGRRSPTQPLKDCWLQKGNTWSRIHDLPEPRYRCRVVAVTLPNNVFGAICFGGKTSPTTVATEILLWEPSRGWCVLPALRNNPIPRFGPNFVRLGFNHGLLFGGLRQDGVICPDLWRWRLVIRDNVVSGISFRPSHALDASIGAYPWFARFNASYGFVQDYLLIIGGIARGGCIPKPYEILSLIGSFSNLGDGKELSLRVTSVEPVRPPGCPRPFLIGNSTLRTRTGMYVILGGGSTCFNYGDLFNSGIWVLHEREAGLAADWVIIPTRSSSIAAKNSDCCKNGAAAETVEFPVIRTRLADAHEFASIVQRSKPAVMTHLDFGPYARLCSHGYLPTMINSREKTFPDKTCQRARSRLKDVTAAQKVSCSVKGSMGSSPPLKALLPPEQIDQLPELTSDFTIPLQLESIEPHVGSISLDTSKSTSRLWYSATATILFQVKGIRKIVLFPPADFSRLDIMPGSALSELSVFDETTRAKTLHAPSGTSPHVAIVRPGDTLFIPPFWIFSCTSVQYDDYPDCPDTNIEQSQSQSTISTRSKDVNCTKLCSSDYTSESATGSAACTSSSRRNRPQEQAVDVVVKVTFRTMTADKYTNTDSGLRESGLAAYDAGRRDIENITKRFIDNDAQVIRSIDQGKSRLNGQGDDERSFVTHQIPRDVTKAFLERLGRELLSKAADL